MFFNIGKKIKTLAKFITWFGIGLSLLYGIIMLAVNPLLGVLVAGIGTLVAWISSFMLYGFGELVDKTAAIADKLGADDNIES